MSWQNKLPKAAHMLKGTTKVAYSWVCHEEHEHEITCLWIWHDCAMILGEGTVAPGEAYGWRPTGVRTHTWVSAEPVHIEPSVYWPECCGLHGFVRDGEWISA